MKKYFILFLYGFIFTTCSTQKNVTNQLKDEGIIEVQFLHINDVYEIFPLENGKVGGLARVAALSKKLKADNPNTLAIMAGDFLNPSVIGTLDYEGKRVKGRQMIEVMNEFIDLATFGNHEFDLDKQELIDRLNESKFKWVNANCWYNNGGTFTPFTTLDKQNEPKSIPQTWVWNVKNKQGTMAKIGFFGVTIPSTKKDYVHYDDFYTAAKECCHKLKEIEKCDVVIGITHLNIADDQKLAAMLPDVPLLMGGHDHNNMLLSVGNTKIAKADANAKTAYCHKIKIVGKTKKVTLNSELILINNQLNEDETTQKIVEKWEKIASISFSKSGIEPKKVVTNLTKPINGTDGYNRSKPSELGHVITAAMLKAWADTVDCAVVNGGSIRLDDVLENTVTQYDILRTLPFGGGIPLVKMKGTLLKKLLDAGEKNKGSGGYLQHHNIEYAAASESWLIKNNRIDDNRFYTVVLTDYLLSGKEKGLDFVTKNNSDILWVQYGKKDDTADPKSDIRKALIQFWQLN